MKFVRIVNFCMLLKMNGMPFVFGAFRRGEISMCVEGSKKIKKIYSK